MMMEAQVKVRVGDWSCTAHGRGSKSAISKSNNKKRIATEEEANREWESGRPEWVKSAFVWG